MHLAVTGWSVLCSAGIGRAPFSAAVSDGAARSPAADVRSLYTDALPSTRGHVVPDLNARTALGRKGTGSLDRRTVLALIACRDALGDAGVSLDDSNRHRIGVTLGTTWGSFQAMSDYTKDTFVEERPYLVEPARFPNTVMNCAAGQAAIWFGLKGVNATVAGGAIAFLNALEYATNLLRCGYADRILAGAVEEFTPHTAWATHLLQDPASDVPTGEAAAVFMIERAQDASAAQRHVHGEVLSVAIGFAPGGVAGGGAGAALARCIRRALDRAQIDPHEVSLVATVERGDDPRGDNIESDAIRHVFNGSCPRRIAPKALFGDCHAALGALQLGAVLVLRADHETDARVSLLTACTDEGAVGAAVVKA